MTRWMIAVPWGCLLLAGCGESRGETLAVQNLAAALGETRVYAEGSSMCPPDKPHFKGGKCREACKEGYEMLDSGVCRKPCVSGYRKEGGACFKQEGSVKISDATEKCGNCIKFVCTAYRDLCIGRFCGKACHVFEGIKKCCKCDGNLKVKVKNNIVETEAFCYSSSYNAEYTPPGSDLKRNCRGLSPGLCGRGSASHCTVKFGTCVWNAPGFPDCIINGNMASCYKTE